jgi:hypothetical protein
MPSAIRSSTGVTKTLTLAAGNCGLRYVPSEVISWFADIEDHLLDNRWN